MPSEMDVDGLGQSAAQSGTESGEANSLCGVADYADAMTLVQEDVDLVEADSHDNIADVQRKLEID